MPTDPLIEALAETDAAEDAISVLTAGDILHQARQRLGLNEKEVADKLHITRHYVKALESNSYEKLPGAVFAKGYLKSYALLLGLDVEDLLSRYDEFTHQQKADSKEERRLLRARKKKCRNKPLVIISLLVFIAGFFLTLVFKLGPHYLDNRIIAGAIQQVGQSDLDDETIPDIRRKVADFFTINNIIGIIILTTNNSNIYECIAITFYNKSEIQNIISNKLQVSF